MYTLNEIIYLWSNKCKFLKKQVKGSFCNSDHLYPRIYINLVTLKTCFVLLSINPYKMNNIFLYPLKISENFCFTVFSWVYRKMILPWNWLKCRFWYWKNFLNLKEIDIWKDIVFFKPMWEYFWSFKAHFMHIKNGEKIRK